MKNFKEILDAVKLHEPVTFVVSGAESKEALEAMYRAAEIGIAQAILLGDRKKIEEELIQCDIPLNYFPIEHIDGESDIVAKRTVELVKNGKAGAILKGKIDTSVLLKAILNEKSFRTDRSMNVIGIIESPHYKKLLFISDAGFIIKPNLKQKVDIINNAVDVLHKLGISNPKVAIVCAKEKVSEKMPDTIDAAELVKMNRAGSISGCVVEGPFGFDNAISIEAAKLKGLENEVAGNADIVVLPDLVSANVLYKSFGFLTDAKIAGYMVGSRVPVIITSRADNMDTKLNSLGLAAFMASVNTEGE